MVKVLLTPYKQDNVFFANSYIVIDSNNNALIIDPGKDSDEAIRFIKESNLNFKGILLTHGHFDHIRNTDRLINEFNVPFFIHKEDEILLSNPLYNCSRFENVKIISKPTRVEEGTINIINEPIKVIHTPYHTEGSVCYYFPNSGILFTGDSLFKGSVGRSDLPFGDESKMKSSLSKLISLPKMTKIYSGHSEITTIGYELETNWFVKNI